MKLTHLIRAALAALSLPLILQANDPAADRIRENLALGDYAAAEKAGNVKGAALTDNVRVLRSYARLASALQAEAAATGTRLGATTARLDLFDFENTRLDFPTQPVWASGQRTAVKRVSRTALKLTVPAPMFIAEDSQPDNSWNPFSRFEGPFKLGDVDSSKLPGQPVASFVNTTRRTQYIRFRPLDDYDYDGSDRLNALGYLFINRALATPGYTANTPDYFPVNRLDYTVVLFHDGAGFDFVSWVRSTYTRDLFVILQPGQVLTVFPRRDRWNSLDIVSLPLGVSVHNGVYPEKLLPRLAATAHSSDVFTRMAGLVRSAIDPSITDLTAVKPGHRLELSGEESISCFPTLIEDADRQAWLGALKLAKAASQLPVAYDLGLPIGGTRLFDGTRDLIDILNQNPNLLKLGRMSASARVALGALILDAIGHLERAADLGVASRDPRADADYLFSASLTEDTMPRFTLGAGNTIALAPSYSRNALQITNAAFVDRTLSLKIAPSNAVLRFYGHLSVHSRAVGSTETNTLGPLWFYGWGKYLEAYSDSVMVENGGDYVSLVLPARTVLILGGGDDYIESQAGTQFEVNPLVLSPTSLPTGVSLSTTPLKNSTDELKANLAEWREAMAPAGRLLKESALGEAARFSAAPLFSKTPVVLRDRLPQFMRVDDEVKLKPGTSSPLLFQSGLLLNVTVPNWEAFVTDRSF